jgi:hypothetical protein
MKMFRSCFSSFCCAGEVDLPLGTERHVQRLGGPAAGADPAARLHRTPHPFRARVGQHRPEPQQQFGEAASGLLFLQLLELAEAGFQHPRAPCQPLARAETPGTVPQGVQLRQVAAQDIGHASVIRLLPTHATFALTTCCHCDHSIASASRPTLSQGESRQEIACVF